MTKYTDLSPAIPVTCPRTRCESAYSLFANGRQLNANLHFFHTQLPDPHIAKLAIQIRYSGCKPCIIRTVSSLRTQRPQRQQSVFLVVTPFLAYFWPSAFRSVSPNPQLPHLIRVFRVLLSSLRTRAAARERKNPQSHSCLSSASYIPSPLT
jgi:hypothetical protein